MKFIQKHANAYTRIFITFFIIISSPFRAHSFFIIMIKNEF